MTPRSLTNFTASSLNSRLNFRLYMENSDSVQTPYLGVHETRSSSGWSARSMAITLFSNKEAIETILLALYEDYLGQFNAAVTALWDIAPTPGAVDDLKSEVDQLAFVRALRDLIRLLNVLTSFTEFDAKALDLDAQTFEDYKG